MEQWLPVIGYETFYEVSSLGRIRRTYQTKAGRDLHKPIPFLLTPTINSSGYLAVEFKDQKSHTVHSLVCTAFIGPRPKGFDISHKNLNKTDNALENLEYLSRADHLRYSFKHGERPVWQKRGERNSNAQLTQDQVAQIRQLLAEKHPQQKIADRFGVHQASIWRIAHGITWIR